MAVRTLGGLILGLALVAWATAETGGQDQPPAKAIQPKPVAAPYASAHDRALEPKEMVVNEANDHTQYRVEFNGIKGDRVPAYLYVPKTKAPAKAPAYPAILLQYGSGGNKKTDYIVAIGKQFVAQGFVVLTIDAPGRGERKDDGKKVSDSLSLITKEQVMHYCGDYSRSVDYLETRPEVDKARLGYVGISWGAITGITYVAYDQRIKAMASMVGGGNFLGLYNAQAAEKVAKEGSKSSDPVYHVARIAPRPLLFINVTKDQLIMKSWAESLHQAAGPGAKVVWLNTDHFFNGVDRNTVCASVIEFMDKSLAGPKTTAGK
jgi:dienelactone hydrolase